MKMKGVAMAEGSKHQAWNQRVEDMNPATYRQPLTLGCLNIKVPASVYLKWKIFARHT